MGCIFQDDLMSLGTYSNLTLSYWKQFADGLIEVPVEIKIYTNEDEWVEIKRKSFKERYKEFENGICKKHESHFSLLLFCADYQYQEEVFETYLHEIAHAYLHYPRKGKSNLELELEVHDWITVNFREELNRLNQAIAILKRKEKLFFSIKKLSIKEINQLKQEQSLRFFLTDAQKSMINDWISIVENRASSFKQMLSSLKKKAEGE